MKEPKPRNVFLNEADERDHVINCLCWAYAVKSYDDLARQHKAMGWEHGTLEDLADTYKEMVRDGLLGVEFDETGDRFSLVVGPMMPQGSA